MCSNNLRQKRAPTKLKDQSRWLQQSSNELNITIPEQTSTEWHYINAKILLVQRPLDRNVPKRHRPHPKSVIPDSSKVAAAFGNLDCLHSPKAQYGFR
jgi:hypothetical protein